MIEDKHYLLRDYAIGEKHVLALQVTRWREEERERFRGSLKYVSDDHAGLHGHLELFGYYLGFALYSTEHKEAASDT